MSTVQITAQDINKLRQATGAGMMDCRKALTETGGDFEAKEGVVIAKTNDTEKVGYIVTISCETDFVSKNVDVVAFAQKIADAAVENNVNSVDELNEVTVNGAKVSDLINDKLASIGEKIGVSRFERIEAPYVASYIHGAYRMGVLVGLSKEAPEAGKDVAMQIAAMNPLAVDPASVPAETVQRERAIVT